MIPRHLYWSLYRRRNKLLIILFVIVFFVFFNYESKNNPSSATANQNYKTKRNVQRAKTRINRETYTIPEQCRGCPGENSAGVSLTVRIGLICFYS